MKVVENEHVAITHSATVKATEEELIGCVARILRKRLAIPEDANIAVTGRTCKDENAVESRYALFLGLDWEVTREEFPPKSSNISMLDVDASF